MYRSDFSDSSEQVLPKETLENVHLASTRGAVLSDFFRVAWLWTPHQEQKGTKDFVLNPVWSMVSHISDFKGVQGPDLLSSSPQHHLPPLFALGNALRQSPALSFFCLGPPSACRLVGGGLRWGGGKVGQALSPLSCSAAGIWSSPGGLGNVSPHGHGCWLIQRGRAAAPCSSTIPWVA